MPKRLGFVMIEPELFDDRCRVTVVWYEGRRCQRRDVYEDLTLAEAIDVVTSTGIQLDEDPFP